MHLIKHGTLVHGVGEQKSDKVVFKKAVEILEQDPAAGKKQWGESSTEGKYECEGCPDGSQGLLIS